MSVPSNAVDKLIAKVKLNLGRQDNATVDDYALEWINDAQRLICTKQNFWFMHSSTTLTASQGDLTVNLPSDFKDEDSFWIKDSDTVFTELDPMSWEDLRREYDESTQDEPQYWLVDGQTVILRPVPDDTYTIQCEYWKWMTDLVAGGSSNDLVDSYPDAVEAGATYLGFRQLSEFDEAEAWKQIFEANIRDMIADNANRILPDELVMPVRVDVRGTSVRGKAKNR